MKSRLPGNGGELVAMVMVKAQEWEGNVEEEFLKQGEMKQCGAKRNSSRVYTNGGKVFFVVDVASRVRSRLSAVRRLLRNTSFIAPHLLTGENVASAAKTL